MTLHIMLSFNRLCIVFEFVIHNFIEFKLGNENRNRNKNIKEKKEKKSIFPTTCSLICSLILIEIGIIYVRTSLIPAQYALLAAHVNVHFLFLYSLAGNEIIMTHV
jgi:hypothetical protein